MKKIILACSLTLAIVAVAVFVGPSLSARAQTSGATISLDANTPTSQTVAFTNPTAGTYLQLPVLVFDINNSTSNNFALQNLNVSFSVTGPGTITAAYLYNGSNQIASAQVQNNIAQFTGLQYYSSSNILASNGATAFTIKVDVLNSTLTGSELVAAGVGPSSVTLYNYGGPALTGAAVGNTVTVVPPSALITNNGRTLNSSVSASPSPAATTKSYITILSPSSGENIPVGQPYQIAWLDSAISNMNDSFTISLLSTSGTQIIASNVSVTQLQGVGSRCDSSYACRYTWTPSATVNNAQIEVDDSHGNLNRNGLFNVTNSGTVTSIPGNISGSPMPTTPPTAVGTPVSNNCYWYSRNLTIGSRGDDVTALQQELIANGFDIPLISSGQATYGYFGPSTAAAAARFQGIRSISPTGYIGPQTRAYLNTCPSAPARTASASITNNATTVTCPVGYICNPTTTPSPSTSPQPTTYICPIGYICNPISSSGQSAITLVSPNGGESVAVGESLGVIWNSVTPTQPVDVRVFDSNGQTVLVAKNITPANSTAQSIGFATNNGSVSVGKYTAQVCLAGTSICDSSNSTFNVIPPVSGVSPNISLVGPQPTSVGSLVTVWLSNAGRSGNIVLTTADGSKTWTDGYATDVSTLGGFAQYDGTKLSFTIPSTIGRGVNPGWWNEPIVAVTSGTYKLYVSALDANNNFIKSNVVDLQIGTQSSITNCPTGYICNPTATVSPSPSPTTAPTTCPAGFTCAPTAQTIMAGAPNITYVTTLIPSGSATVYGSNFGQNSRTIVDGNLGNLIIPNSFSSNYLVFSVPPSVGTSNSSAGHAIQVFDSSASVQYSNIYTAYVATPSPSVSPSPTYSPVPSYSPTPSYSPSPTYTPPPVYTPTPTYSPSPSLSPVTAMPTASLTIQGGSNYTFNVGQTATYAWNSTNADTFSSTYTSNNPTKCGSGTWTANTANGSVSNVMTSNYSGCSWTVIYTATNSATGQYKTSTVNVSVNLMPSSSPSPSPQASIDGNASTAASNDAFDAMMQSYCASGGQYCPAGY